MDNRRAAALDRYREKLDQITIRPHLEQGEQIRRAAAAKGQSVQAYIIGACKSQMDRDSGGRLYVGIPAETAKRAAGDQDPRKWLAAALAHVIEDNTGGHRKSSGG